MQKLGMPTPATRWALVGAFSLCVAWVVTIPVARILPAGGSVLGADTYNELVGTTSPVLTLPYFVAIVGLIGAFICARCRRSRLAAILDGASLVLVTAVVAGLLIRHLLGRSATGGWFGYAPGAGLTYSPTSEIDLWVFVRVGSGCAALLWVAGIVTRLWTARADPNVLGRIAKVGIGSLAAALSPLAAFTMLSGSTFYWTLHGPFAVNQAGQILRWSQEEYVFDPAGQIVIALIILVVVAWTFERADRSNQTMQTVATIAFVGLAALPSLGWIRLLNISSVDIPLEMMVVSMATLAIAIVTAKPLLVGLTRGEVHAIAAGGLLVLTMLQIVASWYTLRDVTPTQLTDTYYSLMVGESPWYLGGPVLAALAGAFVHTRNEGRRVRRIPSLLGIIGFLIGTAAVVASMAIGQNRYQSGRPDRYNDGVRYEWWLTLGDAGLALIVVGAALCLFSLIRPIQRRRLQLEISP